MKIQTFLFMFFILPSLLFPQSFNGRIYGLVTDSSSGLPLDLCNVLPEGTQYGTSTNDAGEYDLILPYGTYTVRFSFVGYETSTTIITLKENRPEVEYNIALKPAVILGDEVTVIEDKMPATIVQKVEPKDLQKMPTIFSDVLRSVQSLSGVVTNNELTSGYNVRGGSYDENIIYLNGYEIYRPFLLREGYEENQTLINPDMVGEVKFYNGTFPARYGDRMSSVLETNYKSGGTALISGRAHIGLMNAGLAANGRLGKLYWNAGFRYSYPESFITTLQTQGAYHTTFSDIQLMTGYNFSENTSIELTGIYAENEFSLNPTKWQGNFGGFSRGDIRSMEVDLNGDRIYKFTTALAGLRFKSDLNRSTNLSVSLAGYWTRESENQALTSDYYYTGQPNSGVHDYIKTRYEYADNLLKLGSYRVSSEIIHRAGIHTIHSGIEYRSEDAASDIRENTFEESIEHTTERPSELFVVNDFRLTSLSLYAEDQISFSPVFNLNLGLRYLRYEYSRENLISPRISMIYYPSIKHSLTLSWGYYYQPPHIAELKTLSEGSLISQKAVHYVLGWEYTIRENISLHTEVYYKDLDNLIPYYFDDMRMVYTGKNSREGYAYGLDIMLETQLTEGLRTKFGYSFLIAKEKDKGTPMDYITRLAGQTHTLQIFIQDKLPALPHIQNHLRFLWGSGNSFYYRRTEYDEITGEPYIAVDMNRPEELFMYLRVDMGLSADFKIGESNSLIIIAEILNVFNHSNYGSYNWVQILDEVEAPIPIPNLLSPRFLNLRAEFLF